MKIPTKTGRQVDLPMLGPFPPNFKAWTLSHTGSELVPDRVNNTHIQMLGFSISQGRCIHGHAVAQLVEALRYKSEGRGFDSRWYQWNFSGRTMALGLTPPLTDMNARDTSW
jgi:hypothetical protein